ncbi:hypothetical protein VP01_1629g4 [Puccinia sorghi]|uniref:Uncharacterized protein n=1 Tax=Puccinia sorghi TaxID=27349 RepID=A0A0L6VGW8_9BASI|nr:hypothetical protein VP01_1629g4 [Puccinia sorghi]
MFCTAVQSALERLLVDGTRLGVDLKAFDKQLDNQTSLVAQDPSNSNLKTDLARRRALRDGSLNQIKELSLGIAQDLHASFRNSSLQPYPSSSSSIYPRPTAAGTSPHPAGDDSAQTQQQTHHDLDNELKIIHKRIGKHALEVERIDCEHQVAIDGIQQRIMAQKEVIQTIQENLPPRPPEGKIQEVAVIETRDLKSAEKASKPTTSKQLVELEAEVKRVEERVSELRMSVQTILSREIPANLRQSVQLIQQDVDTTVHTAITKGHQHLAQLIRAVIQHFEPRILALERLASQLESSLPNHHTTPSSPKPARLIRRRHDTPSSQININLLSQSDPDECKQQ